MGVLPLQFREGENAQSLGLTGHEAFDVVGLDTGASRTARVVARGVDGKVTEFEARVRIDTPKELDYFRHGGILQYVLRSLSGHATAA